MCSPRLDAGLSPACVAACPTNAIKVEKVVRSEWRADHSSADAPGLPSASITLSTTRITLPRDVPMETYAASDWNVGPEHPHWSLVWLTLISQLAVGVSVTDWAGRSRIVVAALAVAALVGAMAHLGRPIAAYKALRNLRRSWLSREVALLSGFAGLAVACALVAGPALPALALAAAVVGVLGVYASARLYVVPGRPAWNTPLTVVRFFATALALGAPVTGHLTISAIAGLVALATTALNWLRLRRLADRALRLEFGWFGEWTVLRWALVGGGVTAALGGGSAAFVWLLMAAGEVVGRWLFYVAVVPLNTPGTFWRGTAGTDR
jgi:DMSO reductase anchor subunit